MNKTTKLALAFATFAALATSATAAENKWRHGPEGQRHGMMGGFMGGPGGLQRADADNSGDISYEEFAAAFGDRFRKADANGDGELTVEEVADGIQRMQAERMAARMIERLDANEDGKLTVAEIESQQKKIFALRDRNDDGKIAGKELQRRQFGKDRGWSGGRDRDR